MKKVIALLLSILLVITLVPAHNVSVEAASNLVLRVENQSVNGSNYIDLTDNLDDFKSL